MYHECEFRTRPRCRGAQPPVTRCSTLNSLPVAPVLIAGSDQLKAQTDLPARTAMCSGGEARKACNQTAFLDFGSLLSGRDGRRG